MGIFDSTKKLIRRMKNRIKDVGDYKVEVYFPDDEYHVDENDTHRYPRSMAYLAYLQEFGQYSRPFIRPTIDDFSQDWSNMIKQELKAGEDPEKVFERVGNRAKKDIQERMEFVNKPLSNITKTVRWYKENGYTITNTFVKKVIEDYMNGVNVPQSSNDRPLIESAQLYDSVKVKVEKK